MSKGPESETVLEITRRLAARKFGLKFDPLPPTASPKLLDVEEAFPDTVFTSKKATEFPNAESAAFDSEPE